MFADQIREVRVIRGLFSFVYFVVKIGSQSFNVSTFREHNFII